MTVKKAAPLSSQLDESREGAASSQVPASPTPVDPPVRGDNEKKSRRSTRRRA